MSLMSSSQTLAQMTFEQIIQAPDVNACVIRRNDFNKPWIRDDPNVRFGKLLADNYVYFYAKNEILDILLNDNSTKFSCIILGLLSQIDLEASGITAVQQQPYLSLRGGGTLIGIIDTGIDFTNTAFQWEDGNSKIQALWDMTIPGAPPESYLLGSEYTQDQITLALRSDDPHSIVPHHDTDGHGTFLAGMAASHDAGMYTGAAPDAELVVVKLKEVSNYYRSRALIPEEQHNAFESCDLMLGIDYCLAVAQKLGRPISVCIGLGTNQGGHDGYNVLEDYLTAISYQSGVAVCAAAGNESRAKHHASGALASTGATEEVEIRVGDSRHSVYLSLWNTASDRMSVSLQSPTGEVVSRIPARSGEITTTRLVMENATVRVNYGFPLSGSGGQVTTVRIFDPTPGIWKLNIYGEIILNGSYHVWLSMTGLGNPTAEFLLPDPNYTVVVPATALGVITCGAFNSTDKSLFITSSWGPTRHSRASPNLTAPGVEVGGISSQNGYTALSGSSVAAAITAGASALLLQWGLVDGNESTMNTYHIRAILIRGCDRDPGVQYPNHQWGYGRLNLYNSFLQLRVS
ncbi:MAG: S8 family peptidase [Clostridiales bacterium]|jgi:subtilisin family serine protease|nr:S8 family peptidase [Clostridiales bacterium]